MDYEILEVSPRRLANALGFEVRNRRDHIELRQPAGAKLVKRFGKGEPALILAWLLCLMRSHVLVPGE